MNMENLLENNSNEMKTVVETFVIEESAELIYDGEALQDWNRMVEELSLAGQKCITKTDKSPVPFMHMKSNLVNVFSTLCPRKVDVKDYSATPIPLEILRLISLSNNEKYFDKIQIWYDDKTPDPACIGLMYTNENDREKGYTWNMQSYLLGKWADVKHSFEELTEMAKKRYVSEKKNEYSKIVRDYQRRLDDIEQEAFDMFGHNSNGNDINPF